MRGYLSVRDGSPIYLDSRNVTRPIVFWGASGHARVLRELVESTGYTLIALFDNDSSVRSPFADIPIHHGVDGFTRWAADHVEESIACLVAIGGARGRDRVLLQQVMCKAGLEPIVAIHATAFIAADVQLGAGCQVLANAAVCVDTKFGQACVVNTKASVDHECCIGHGVHIAPGATLAGCVSVGDCTLIGPAAVVLPRINIGSNVIIGAGAVVTRDVPNDVVAYGNPARVVRANAIETDP